jgi:hypothetical protein
VLGIGFTFAAVDNLQRITTIHLLPTFATLTHRLFWA